MAAPGRERGAAGQGGARASDGRGRWRLRPATAADHGRIERLLRELDGLHARLQPSFFRAPRGARRSEDELRRALGRNDELILLALAGDDDDELAGLVHVRVHQAPPAPELAQRRRAHVEELVVSPAARRRGCGRRLMAEATRWARARGAEQILLTVWRGNEEAEAFYGDLGYRAVSSVLALDLGAAQDDAAGD